MISPQDLNYYSSLVGGGGGGSISNLIPEDVNSSDKLLLVHHCLRAVCLRIGRGWVEGGPQKRDHDVIN